MVDHHETLALPVRTNTEDPGAHDLDSDSEDHFSDAHSAPTASSRNSPIPRTRVEKISDEPSYGEVPGTEAYQKREEDAAPDEIAVVPDSANAASALESALASPSALPPGGKPIPTTVVEESADGDGARTPDGKKHASDPLPDLVVKADGTLEGGTCANVNASIPPTMGGAVAVNPASDDADGGSSSDDFDDFAEGGNGGRSDGDDDFGDFDAGFETPAPGALQPPLFDPTITGSEAQAQPQSQIPPQPLALSLPVPDFDGLDPDSFLQIVTPYLNGLYFHQDEVAPSPPPPPAAGNPLFLTPRSASLWSQLVAPPPLQPPDWIRSRIRRLFLVSLGVPVDLDEILPASKQKKLVLPSLSVHLQHSPRTSTDSRRSGRDKDGNSGGGTVAAKHGVARLKQSGTNGSSSSVDSAAAAAAAAAGGSATGTVARSNSGRAAAGASSSSRKRRGPPPPPDFDLVTARQLCMTTDEALGGMTDAELQAHIRRLGALEGTAKEALEYWTKRTDEKIGERETFEGVIENLVAHARKTRK